MTLASLKKLTARIKGALVSRTTGGAVLALAQEYAQGCEEAAVRLERCCELIVGGKPLEASRLAEETPPLPEVLAILRFEHCEQWIGFCAAHGLAVPNKFEEGHVAQLAEIYTSGVIAPQRLWRDYRGAVMQNKDASALQTIRAITRLNPGDADALSEKARLETKLSQQVATSLRVALEAGDKETAGRLAEELEDLQPAEPTEAVVEQEVTSPAVVAVAATPSSIGDRRRASASSGRKDGRPPVSHPLVEKSSRRAWIWAAAAGALLIVAGLWYARPGVNRAENEKAAIAEGPSQEFRSVVTEAAWETVNAAGSLRGVDIPEDEPASALKSLMAKVIRTRTRPVTLAESLTRLTEIRAAADNSEQEQKLAGRILEVMETEAWVLCRNQKSPPAPEEVRYWPRWTNRDVATNMNKISTFLTVPEMEAPVFFPGDEPVWFAAECERRKAKASEEGGKKTATITTPQAETVAVEEPARVTILKSWQDLDDIAPGADWRGGMVVRPPGGREVDLKFSSGAFRPKDQPAGIAPFGMADDMLLKNDEVNYNSVDLLLTTGNGRWRIYCATAPDFEKDRARICALPEDQCTVAWQARERSLRPGDSVIARLKQFHLSPRQAWVLECTDPDAPEGLRVLELVKGEFASLADYVSRLESRLQPDFENDSVVLSLKKDIAAAKARMDREIKMQLSSANKDRAVNAVRDQKIREIEKAFHREETDLLGQIKFRCKKIEQGLEEALALFQRLTETGSFYLSLRLTKSSAPLVRLLELRVE